MKYNLVTWTAYSSDGENFSGNANLEWEGDSPSDEAIIEKLKSKNAKLENCRITLQDRLEFDSREELDNYGKM